MLALFEALLAASSAQRKHFLCDLSFHLFPTRFSHVCFRGHRGPHQPAFLSPLDLSGTDHKCHRLSSCSGRAGCLYLCALSRPLL